MFMNIWPWNQQTRIAKREADRAMRLAYHNIALDCIRAAGDELNETRDSYNALLAELDSSRKECDTLREQLEGKTKPAAKPTAKPKAKPKET